MNTKTAISLASGIAVGAVVVGVASENIVMSIGVGIVAGFAVRQNNGK